MGRSLGLSNSALFYERAFLLVEGESEENALPHLYRNLYRRGLFEDGIILVNLRSCGAWKGALGVIRANKAATTVVLLDSDCRRPGSSAKLTPERLTEVGFPPAFLADNCFFVGVKEFEDAFATGDILVVLNSYWPKEDGTAWTAAEVDVFREGQRKFSRELLDHVRRSGRPDRRSTAKKPEFAQRLARHCITEDRVPEAIRQVFCRLRILSGTADGGG
jgi:hypothetical protein